VGYLIAWAVRKGRRVAGRLNAEADLAIDAGLDRLHEAVVAKLGPDSPVGTLEAEAAAEGGVEESVRTGLQTALADAVNQDPDFAARLHLLLTELGHLDVAATTGIDLRGASGVQVNQAGGNIQFNKFD
jgi:hypothetical protein